MFATSTTPTRKHRSPLGVGRLSWQLLFGVILVGALLTLAHPKRAYAYATLHPDPAGQIPATNYDDLQSRYLTQYNCPTKTSPPPSPALTHWIALASNSAATTVNIPYGTSALDLQYWLAGTQCRKTKPVTTLQIVDSIQVIAPGDTGPSGTVVMPTDSTLVIPWPPNDPGGYRSDKTSTFTYFPAGGFTKSGTYTVLLKSRAANAWNNPANFIQCANPVDGGKSTDLALDGCTPDTIPFFIYVSVNPIASGSLLEVSCNQISGYAFDRDSPNTSLYIDIYIDGNLVQPRWQTTLNDPVLNAQFGISGNHKFVFTSYPGYRDGRSHQVTAFAHGVDAAGREDGSGNWLTGNGNFGPCYNATCRLDINGGNPVIVSQPFTVSATFTNTGPTSWQGTGSGQPVRMAIIPPVKNDDWWAPITGSSPTNRPPPANERIELDRTIGPGGSVTFTFTGTAPSSLQKNDISVQLLIENQFFFGQECTKNVDLWQNFTLTPGSIMQFDNDESPSTATYGSSITANGTPSGGVQATITRSLTWVPYGGAPRPLPPFSSNFRYPTLTTFFKSLNGIKDIANVPAGFKAGDQVCGTISISLGGGLVDIDGNIINPTSVPPSTSCKTVVDEPYLTFYGNDVSTGSTFNPPSGSCTPKSAGSTPPSQIQTYYSPVKEAGAGVQFAAMALDAINQFSSASFQSISTGSENGLSFANTVNLPYGGKFNAATHCIPNYFGINPTPVQTGPYWVNPGGSALSDGAPKSIGPGPQAPIYVDGDAIITNDIIFANSGGYVSLANIPTFYLIVRGNIYIGPHVHRLDGVFVAQPGKIGPAHDVTVDDPLNGGRIYTCAKTDGTLFPASALYSGTGLNDCSQQLVVNGVFVAQQVRFLRTAHSLRNAAPGVGEYGNPPISYGNGAEVFNFSPELYLAPSPLGGGATGVKYDYIASLPPVL